MTTEAAGWIENTINNRAYVLPHNSRRRIRLLDRAQNDPIVVQIELESYMCAQAVVLHHLGKFPKLINKYLMMCF